eukprot:1860069-Rhodomonas_salina.1
MAGREPEAGAGISRTANPISVTRTWQCDALGQCLSWYRSVQCSAFRHHRSVPCNTVWSTPELCQGCRGHIKVGDHHRSDDTREVCTRGAHELGETYAALMPMAAIRWLGTESRGNSRNSCSSRPPGVSPRDVSAQRLGCWGVGGATFALSKCQEFKATYELMSSGDLPHADKIPNQPQPREGGRVCVGRARGTNRRAHRMRARKLHMAKTMRQRTRKVETGSTTVVIADRKQEARASLHGWPLHRFHHQICHVFDTRNNVQVIATLNPRPCRRCS